MRPILLLPGLALGALMATGAGAEPLELTDAQMDAVTAGAVTITLDQTTLVDDLGAGPTQFTGTFSTAGATTPCMIVELPDGTLLVQDVSDPGDPHDGGGGEPF